MPPSPSYLVRRASSKPRSQRDASEETEARTTLPKTPPLKDGCWRDFSENTEETEETPRGQKRSDGALPSSPTLQRGADRETMGRWQDYRDRRLSIESSSIHSDDLDRTRWTGLGGTESSDGESISQGSFEDNNGHMSKIADSDDEEFGVGVAYSSAALSRRAEIVLANAKKRLNLMEGNLRGARDALPAPLTFQNLARAASVGSHDMGSKRRLVSDTRLTLGRFDDLQSPPLSPTDSRRDSNMFSEPAIARSQSISHAPPRRLIGDVRMPRMPGSNASTSSDYTRSRPLRGSRSQEVIRDSSWATRDPLRRTSPEAARSPSLETLPEGESSSHESSPWTHSHNHALHRSQSTTGDLRDQMQDLKGRISSLRERAREDSMRRRSLQSLRESSAFTAADVRDDSIEGTEQQPHSDDSGVRFNPAALSAEKHRALNALNESRARDLTRTENSLRSRQAITRNESNDEESEYEDAEETRHRSRPASSLLESPVPSRTRYTNESQESETDGESIYEEPEYEPVAERHEDRADAFDYQNFFLHSAVGTYGQPTRRSSVSSTGSADTARGPAPNDSQEPPATPETPEALRKIERAMHRRVLSKDSVASMATFATAAEGQDDESKGQHYSQGHNWPIPAIEAHRPNRQANGERTDSGYGSPERRVGKPDASTLPLLKYYNHHTVDQSSQNAVDAAVSALVKSAASPATPRSALSVDNQDLVHGLVRSLQQVCVRLQETSGNQYESRIWRRRLDEAKRVLDGNQEGEAY
ncbi:hypothetical protein LTR04_005068 [Oleoguttula sp. CCFEE 6159]|nr:hypothetical protein LTR04_005068 [Oleoguttula sp. CCFEE 6159]